MKSLQLHGENPRAWPQYAERPKFKLPSDFDWIVDARAGVGKTEMAVVYNEHSTKDFLPALISYEVVGPKTAELFEIETSLQVNIDPMWGGGTVILVKASGYPAGFSKCTEVVQSQVPASILSGVYTRPNKAIGVLLTWIETLNKQQHN